MIPNQDAALPNYKRKDRIAPRNEFVKDLKNLQEVFESFDKLFNVEVLKMLK